MEPLPQLIEEDIESLDEVLNRLISQTEADVALVTDRAGFLIVQRGGFAGLDQTTLAALAANTYAATAAMAGLISESDFSCLYQEGDQHSLMIKSVGEYGLLVVVFGARISGGAVKYFASSAVRDLSEQMKIAYRRSPDVSIDLATINVADTSGVFRRKR
jgi:predicted regulator of Ras-like GTPase activity (Roadblock/LC7/MglB family)